MSERRGVDGIERQRRLAIAVVVVSAVALVSFAYVYGGTLLERAFRTPGVGPSTFSAQDFGSDTAHVLHEPRETHWDPESGATIERDDRLEARATIVLAFSTNAVGVVRVGASSVGTGSRREGRGDGRPYATLELVRGPDSEPETHELAAFHMRRGTLVEYRGAQLELDPGSLLFVDGDLGLHRVPNSPEVEALFAGLAEPTVRGPERERRLRELLAAALE